MKYDINTTIKALMSNPRDRDNTVPPHGDKTVTFAEPGRIIFTNGGRYRMEEAPRNGSCFGCDLLENGVCQKNTHIKIQTCSGYTRYDGRWMIFKKV